MAHSVILLKQLISELQASTTDPDQQNLIGDLWPAAEKLDKKTREDPPHPHVHETHEVLEALQLWLQTANVAAPNFAAELDSQIAAMQQYLP